MSPASLHVVDCSAAPVPALAPLAARLAASRAPLEPGVPAVLYGFFWTDCVYESGLMLQSLHRSKVGALRAMIAFQAARWDACRSGADSGLHRDGFGRFDQLDYRDFRSSQAFAVRPVRLLP